MQSIKFLLQNYFIGLKNLFMYIAMNRFKIIKGKENDFEQIWRSRDSHLESVPGFKKFHLIKGSAEEDFTLYASHSVWESRDAFISWTKSESFRLAHQGAGKHVGIYIGHPVFEGFEVVI